MRIMRAPRFCFSKRSFSPAIAITLNRCSHCARGGDSLGVTGIDQSWGMHDTEQLERWLAGEVFGKPASGAPCTFLAHLNPFERNKLLNALLRQRSDLFAA